MTFTTRTVNVMELNNPMLLYAMTIKGWSPTSPFSGDSVSVLLWTGSKLMNAGSSNDVVEWTRIITVRFCGSKNRRYGNRYCTCAFSSRMSVPSVWFEYTGGLP